MFTSLDEAEETCYPACVLLVFGEKRMKQLATLAWLLGISFAAFAQRAGAPSQGPTPATPALVAPGAQVSPGSNTEFLHAADEVLAQMSQLLDLPIKEPLKKTLRSKQEIRDYLIREEKEDKDEAQRDADKKTLEAFGLIPKDFPLDSFMLDVLTDQIAGLYDPKAKEFYIADWIPLDEQKAVMAHELTHALEDQSFHIDPWIKAARPNDDAELARESVSEGSAMAAMVDYTLRDQKMSVRDLPDVTLLIRSGAIEEMSKDPNLSKAPPYIRDDLLFPYLAGTTFSQQFLKAHSGWGDLRILFSKSSGFHAADHPPRLVSRRRGSRSSYAARMEAHCPVGLEASRGKCDGRIQSRRSVEAVLGPRAC